MRFEVFTIPHDDESARAWLERVKSFRLLSLQTAPESYLSTYAREVAFTDDIWYGRLTNPCAYTLVALDSGRILSSLTLVGPLPIELEGQLPSQNEQKSTDATPSAKEPDTSRWRLDAMFTLPEVRGQGVAKALIEKAIAFGCERAGLLGEGFAGTIVVDANNIPAQSLYKKCGFVVIREEVPDFGSSRTVLVMEFVLGSRALS